MKNLSFHVDLDPRQISHELTEKDIQEVREVLPDLLTAVLAVRYERRLAALETLVELFAGRAEITPADSAQARMEGRARSAIQEGTDWYTAQQVAEFAKLGPGNPIGSVSRWKAQGRVFALRQGNRDLYPRYALGIDFHPLPAMKDLLRVLDKRSGEWLATWFESTNGFLGGKRPRELLLSDPARVLEAAKDEVESREFAS
ncbi:hypothetical protein [Variovorax sp. J22R115]|uniref:hypothetical protein n=1 Tax=Variovorax sp. J22R115 TaxID=3053509 RepID=UPI0025776177|nr:hypothetical protein [Variovorax sp. J22R115]MDM0053921.1 hypothetical protein [Variovorax sp. J22R115]